MTLFKGRWLHRTSSAKPQCLVTIFLPALLRVDVPTGIILVELFSICQGIVLIVNRFASSSLRSEITFFGIGRFSNTLLLLHFAGIKRCVPAYSPSRMLFVPMHSGSQQCLNVASCPDYFHGSNAGSNPARVANKTNNLRN